MPTRTATGAARRGVRAALVTGLAASVALAGCSTRTPVEEITDDTASTAFEPITITDQRGVTITFDEPIERIATTVIPAPSMLTAIDQSYDRIVGVNQATIGRDKGSTFETMFPQAVTNTVIAGSDFVPNVETIIELDPDVVIQWADQGDPETLIEPIEAAGIPVIALKYGTQEYLETWIELFATLLGQEERGEELLAIMHDTLDEVAAIGEAHDEHPTTLFLRAAGDGGYNAGMSASTGYMHTWMTSSGATNVGADEAQSSTTAVSSEQLIEWDPEVIFLSSMTATTPADLYADPALAGLSAIQNHRVYAVPSGGFWWEPPSAEANLTHLWATAVLNPDSGIDLRAEIREHYEFLYGYELDDDEIDDILRLDANADAAGYEQFAR